jgi:hypothetical protein
MVIPNSKLVINPGADLDEWHKELYLRPGQWIPWVGATVLGTMVGLAGVVLVLHLNEKVRLFFVAFPHRTRLLICVASFSFSWVLAGGRAGAAACIASY